jgi:hypothetical protein
MAVLSSQAAMIQRVRIWSVVIFLCCCISLQAISQEFSYVHYDEKDGLPSSTIYDVTQDADGFVWFATENGLTRFDGVQFKTFSTDDGLPDNSILRIHADKTGRVYFSPFTYTPYYYYKDSIYKLKISPGYEKGLSLIFEFFNQGDKILISDVQVHAHMIDNNDSVVPLHNIYRNLPSIISVLRTTDSLIIAGTRDTLYYINSVTGQLRSEFNAFRGWQTVPLEDGSARRIRKIPANMVFIEGKLANNIYYSSDANNAISFFSTITGELLARIKVEKPSNVYLDTENNLWITTTGNGIYRFPSFEYRHTRFDKTSEVFSLNSYAGGILAGIDYSKVYLLTTTDTAASRLFWDHSSYLSRSENPVAITSKANRITRLIVNNDIVYVGADAFLLKLQKNKPTLFSKVFPVKDIDNFDNRLLVCTGSAVILMDAVNLTVLDTLLRQRATSGVLYDGEYYVATIGGLQKINPVDKTIVDLRPQHASFNTRITAMKKGTDNDLWIASGKGLIHYKAGKVLEVFGKRSGITSDICTSLFIDGDYVWVGTNKGLNKINMSAKQPRITSFTTANGLVSNFINTIFVCGDTVYAGTSTGLTYFNKHLETPVSICRLHILQVSQGNQQLAIDSIYKFPYHALNIRISFTAISFKSAGDNIYHYQLEGLDTGWNTTSGTLIDYPTLPPGRYRLLLKAVNKFGVESETKTIVIIIAHPWWQAWWLLPAFILMAAAVVFLWYSSKIRSIKKKEAAKRQNESKLVVLEQQALQAQMNPHFIFNCLNSIQAYILKLDAVGASRYLNGFASMIRQTLDFSSRLLITVSDEVKYIHTYLQLEKLRYKEKFNYNIEVDEDIDQATTLLPGMLLQPYIENSLRHGIQHRADNNGLISLKIIPAPNNGIICLISDNGIGRKKSEEMKSAGHIEYQSKGTLISQKRIDAINNQLNTAIRITTEDILDADGAVAGTLVTILIPQLNNYAV